MDAASSDAAPIQHGGDLGAARLLFPGAPEPFIDLSTGINPYPYPIPQLPPDLFTRLPEPAALDRLAAVAARAYGAPSAAHVVAAPGTQILLPLVAALVRPGRAAVLGPTYAEHARAAAHAGHQVERSPTWPACAMSSSRSWSIPTIRMGGSCRAKPCWPAPARCRRMASWWSTRPSWMCAPTPAASRRDVGRPQYRGAAFVRKILRARRVAARLCARGSPAVAARLRAGLGPWAVAGPAIAIGAAALQDRPWAAATRARLAHAALRLDQILTGAGLEVVGGTSLFRLVQTPAAPALFGHLGRAGILVRRFAHQAAWLRFGLPAGEPEWQRLAAAVAAFEGTAGGRATWRDGGSPNRGAEAWRQARSRM